MEGYIRRLLWALVHLGVIPLEAANDPWGPQLPPDEFETIGRTLNALALVYRRNVEVVRSVVVRTLKELEIDSSAALGTRWKTTSVLRMGCPQPLEEYVRDRYADQFEQRIRWPADQEPFRQSFWSAVSQCLSGSATTPRQVSGS